MLFSRQLFISGTFLIIPSNQQHLLPFRVIFGRIFEPIKLVMYQQPVLVGGGKMMDVHVRGYEVCYE